VRADELGFTSDEAEALLNGRLQLGLAREDIDDLVVRIEGWPAGLYLAALSLRGVEDRHEFIRRFGGRSRNVVDFLVDEVLSSHDPATQTVMLRSSILKRLCGPLCDAVLEREDTGGLLSELSRTNLFLVPLDDQGEWYRFHHLFAQLLRVELEHREAGVAATLHRRAHVWHRDHGTVDEAIEHALEAGAFAEAGAEIEAAWTRYAHVARYATVLAWLERFPVEIMRDCQRLLLVHAWVLSLSARRDDAAKAIARVEELGHLDAGPLPDGFSSLESSVAALRGIFPWGDVGTALGHARRAAELEDSRSPWWPAICWALGACHYFGGDSAEADRWYAQTAELAPASGQWIVGVSAVAYRSLIAGEGGRLEEQASLAGDAVRLAREHGVDAVDGEVFVAAGKSLEAREKPDEGLPLFERGVSVLRSFGQPLELANALICHASVLRVLGDTEGLRAVIAEARATIDSCPDPGILGDRLVALERRAGTRPPSRGSELSQRELLVLRLLRGSLSESDIGRELYLSHNTIHSHTKAIYRKLGVSSRAEAVARAGELGLI
jgi:LuxR family transcriptional regulator, maltose regulon positive regulatory protein